MKKQLLISLALMGFAGAAIAADSTGNIAVLRATTDSTLHPVDQRNMIIFQLSNGHSANCGWLQVNKDNPYFVSTLLSA